MNKGMCSSAKLGPFTLVGPNYCHRQANACTPSFLTMLRGKPVLAMLLLALVVAGCFFAQAISHRDAAEFYLMHRNQPPGAEFWFGTDSLGRDIWAVLWQGGGTSLVVGLLSAAVSATLGIMYGCISGMAPARVDNAMMRLAELLQSVPPLLALLLICALMQGQTPFSLALIMGATAWFSLARIVRSEVRQIRCSEYILAARCMGAGRARIMLRHLIPNFISTIIFIVVAGVGTGIAMESTLSFLGLGLPVEVPSWGSMLALADRALLLNTWWVIVIPGVFLVLTLMCITSIGQYLRKRHNPGYSCL